MVRRDQLRNFLPRDRLASLAELEHLRHTLALIRDTNTPALDRPMTAPPTLEPDLDAGGSVFVLNDLAPPIWIDTPDSPSFADSTPEQSRNAWIDWLTKQDRERPVPRQFIERWRAKGWPHLGATSAIQTISKEEERISNVVADRPARFNIVDNTHDSGERPWYADDEFGLDEVRKHDRIIEEEASRQGVDPDLVRAIVFVENSHGWYDEYLKPFELNRTVRPMNINPDLWRGLGVSRQTAEDPQVNIRVGTTLLKRLVDRMEEPTPRKVAALWQLTGAEHTDNEGIRNYVARVGQLYRVKPWARPIVKP